MESFEYESYSALLVYFSPCACTITNDLNNKYYVYFASMRGIRDIPSHLCLVILNQREIPKPSHGGCTPFLEISLSNKDRGSIQVTGETRGKRGWKPMGVCLALHVPPPPREPYPCLSLAQHTLLLKVEKPGSETWQSQILKAAEPELLPVSTVPSLLPTRRYLSGVRDMGREVWVPSKVRGQIDAQPTT